MLYLFNREICFLAILNLE